MRRAAAIALAAAAGCATALERTEIERVQGFPGSPKDAERYDAALADLSRGRAKEALAAAVDLRARFPENVLVHRLYQESRIRLNQRAEVVGEYERLARAAPSALHDAMLARLQTDADRGAALAQSSVERDDRFAWGWYARGWWESKRKPPRFDEARAAYERALALQPDLLPALRAYASLVRDKDPEAALDAIRRAIELHPERRSERVFLASVQLHLGEDEAREAEGTFRALLGEQPDDLDSSKGLAAALLERGRWLEAKKIYLALRESHPEDPTILLNLGIVAEEFEKDLAAARAHYRAYLDHGASSETPILEQVRARIWIEEIDEKLGPETRPREGAEPQPFPSSEPATETPPP